MYPAGHARNTTADLRGILAHKFSLLGGAPTYPLGGAPASARSPHTRRRLVRC